MRDMRRETDGLRLAGRRSPRRARDRRLQAAGDLGKRPLRRLRQQGEEPQSSRQGQRRRRLRPRSEDEPHPARLTRPGQARRAGERRLVQPLDLRQRALRRLRVLLEQPRPERQQHDSRRLRARHAQRPRLPRLARDERRPGGERALRQPVDLRRRPLRRLRLARLEPEPPPTRCTRRASSATNCCPEAIRPSRSRTQGAWRALHASDRGRRYAPAGWPQAGTSRESRCAATLRLTRCRALSTVLVSHSRRSAVAS